MVAHYAMPSRLFIAVCRNAIVVFGWLSGMMDGLVIATTPLAGLHQTSKACIALCGLLVPVRQPIRDSAIQAFCVSAAQSEAKHESVSDRGSVHWN